jgi:GntR family transcriptional regulator
VPGASRKPKKATATTPTELAAHYRTAIQDGRLAPGEQLPSHTQVKEEFKTSPTTITAAWRILKTEGLIRTESGKGTYVTEQSDVAVTGAARLRRFERTGQTYAPGEMATKRWVGMRSVADPKIAELLDVELHDEVVIRRRVHRRPGKPPTLDTSYIHTRALGDVPEILDSKPFDQPWHKIYTERTGREVTRSPERRTARLVSNDELKALGLDLPQEVAAAVLVVVNVFHDDEGPLEAWEDVYPPGAWAADEE